MLVIAVVLAIQAVLLINTLQHERAEALAGLERESQQAFSALFLTHPYPMTDKLLLATSELLLAGSPISGGVYLRADGSSVGIFGLPPTLGDSPFAQTTSVSDDGRYLDVLWPTHETGAPHAIAIRLDLTSANLRTDAASSRAMVIAMIATALLGGLILLSGFRVALLPFGDLRRALGLENGRADSSASEWRELTEAALRRERSPRLENPDVERRVEERTAELRGEIEKRAEIETKLSRLAQMANDAVGPMFRLDGEGKVLYANDEARKLMAAWGTVPGGTLPARWRDRFTGFLDRAKPGQFEEQIENRWLCFSIVPYADNGVINVYGFDVTDRPQGSLNKDRNTPSPGIASPSSNPTASFGLAVLSGRPSLEERLAQGLAYAKTHKSGGVLYFVEIDDFAEIAKVVGHEAAVRFLGETGARLRTAVGLAPAILRLERCLFAIIEDGMHGEVPTPDETARRADMIITAITEPFRLDDQTIKTRANVGITTFPGDSANVAQLVRNAEMALEHARGEGDNTCRFFMAATNEIVDTRTERLNALKRALRDETLSLHFQPRIDTQHCRIRAAEALIRWAEPTQPGNLTLPDGFLSLAADGGMMEDIGKWTLEAACNACKSWQEADLPFVQVAVNVPTEMIAEGHLSQIVAETLRKSGLDPAYLEIDVTEEAALAHVSETRQAFDDLRDLGVDTAIDRFTGGALSLRDLCAINPVRLKLCAEQVSAVGADPVAGQAVRAAIKLAEGLDTQIVAIGAETPEQVDFLHTLKVEELQGQAFSAPLPEEIFKSFIDNFTEATLALPEGIVPRSTPTSSAERGRRLI